MRNQTKPFVSVCMMTDCDTVVEDIDNTGITSKLEAERAAMADIITISHGICQRCYAVWLKEQGIDNI